MDHHCPHCECDLKFKILKSKKAPSQIPGKDVLFPYCPSCKEILVHNTDESEVWLGALAIITAGVFMWGYKFHSLTEGVIWAGIYLFIILAASYYNSSFRLKNFKRWVKFVPRNL